MFSKKRCFTLIEMVLVVVGLGILVTIGLFSARHQVRLSAYRSAVAQLQLLRAAVLNRRLETGQTMNCNDNPNSSHPTCAQEYNIDLDTRRWLFDVNQQGVQAREFVGGNCIISWQFNSTNMTTQNCKGLF